MNSFTTTLGFGFNTQFGASSFFGGSVGPTVAFANCLGGNAANLGGMQLPMMPFGITALALTMGGGSAPMFANAFGNFAGNACGGAAQMPSYASLLGGGAMQMAQQVMQQQQAVLQQAQQLAQQMQQLQQQAQAEQQLQQAEQQVQQKQGELQDAQGALQEAQQAQSQAQQQVQQDQQKVQDAEQKVQSAEQEHKQATDQLEAAKGMPETVTEGQGKHEHKVHNHAKDEALAKAHAAKTKADSHLHHARYLKKQATEQLQKSSKQLEQAKAKVQTTQQQVQQKQGELQQAQQQEQQAQQQLQSTAQQLNDAQQQMGQLQGNCLGGPPPGMNPNQWAMQQQMQQGQAEGGLPPGMSNILAMTRMQQNAGIPGFGQWGGCNPPPAIEDRMATTPPIQRWPAPGAHKLTQDGPGQALHYTTSGGYTVSVNHDAVTITDQSGRHQLVHSGDPHEYIDGSHVKDWDEKTRSVILDDGTKITMEAPAANGVIQHTSIYDGAEQIQISNGDNSLHSLSFDARQTARAEGRQADGETAYFGHDVWGDLVYRDLYTQDASLAVKPHMRDLRTIQS